MNCGYGDLEYEQSYSLELPIIEEYLQCTLLKFSSKSNRFEVVLNKVRLPSNSKVKLAKFYALFYDKSIKGIRKFKNNGCCNKLDNWDIIKLTQSSNNSVINASVLSDNQPMRELATRTLFLVNSESICTNSMLDIKAVVCYILPSNINTRKNKVDSVCFSVLKMPLILDYKVFKQELEKTQQFQSFNNLLKNKGYSLVISINGKRYNSNLNSTDKNYFSLNENGKNSIICTFEDNVELIKQRKKKENLEQTCDKDVYDKVSFEIALKVFGNVSESNDGYQSVVQRLKQEIDDLEKVINTLKSESIVFPDEMMGQCILSQNGTGQTAYRKEQEVKLVICKQLLSVYQVEVSHFEMINDKLEKFALKYDIAKNKSKFVRNNLKKIEDCVEMYYRTSYISSSRFKMRCKCYELFKNNDLIHAPIVCFSKVLVESPNILILKLNRGNITVNKTSHPVKFAKKLQNKELLNHKYKLFGVCYHSGSNDGGHYVARVKKLGTDDEWWNCNDSSVHPFRASVPYDDAMVMCFAKQLKMK